jgi:hypothetical protein
MLWTYGCPFDLSIHVLILLIFTFYGLQMALRVLALACASHQQCSSCCLYLVMAGIRGSLATRLGTLQHTASVVQAVH